MWAAHPDRHQHGVSIQSSINLGKSVFPNISHKKNCTVLNLGEDLCTLPPFISQILHLVYWTVLFFLFWWREGENHQNGKFPTGANIWLLHGKNHDFDNTSKGVILQRLILVFGLQASPTALRKWTEPNHFPSVPNFVYNRADGALTSHFVSPSAPFSPSWLCVFSFFSLEKREFVNVK